MVRMNRKPIFYGLNYEFALFFFIIYMYYKVYYTIPIYYDRLET